MKICLDPQDKISDKIDDESHSSISTKHKLGFKFDMRILWRMTQSDSFFFKVDTLMKFALI